MAHVSIRRLTLKWRGSGTIIAAWHKTSFT